MFRRIGRGPGKSISMPVSTRDKPPLTISKKSYRKTPIPIYSPRPPFLINGNLRFTAGIAEMLIQSHRHGIELLPALPQAWANGSVKGLCARGGFVVDMTWRNQQLTTVTIHSQLGGECHLLHLTDQDITHCSNPSVRIQNGHENVYFNTHQEQTYNLDFQHKRPKD